MGTTSVVKTWSVCFFKTFLYHLCCIGQYFSSFQITIVFLCEWINKAFVKHAKLNWFCSETKHKCFCLWMTPDSISVSLFRIQTVSSIEVQITSLRLRQSLVCIDFVFITVLLQVVLCQWTCKINLKTKRQKKQKDKKTKRQKDKDKINKRPYMCYIFEKLRVQGY